MPNDTLPSYWRGSWIEVPDYGAHPLMPTQTRETVPSLPERDE